MKNNIDFYRHYSDSHQTAKFKMLRVKYGWAGEGKFWALNNMIAQASDCWLDISKKFVRADLCFELDFTQDELDNYINYLKKDCELLIEKNSCVSTNRIQDILQALMQERERCKDKRKQGSTKGRPKDDRGRLEKDRGQISHSISKSKSKSKSISKKKQFLDYVFLKEDEYENLIKEFGKKKADACIKKLDNFIPNSGKAKSYKDHNRVIRGWVSEWYDQNKPMETLKL